MSPYKDWLEETTEKINKYKETFSKQAARKYKLELLEKVSKRVDEFSSMCGECYQHRGEITNLLDNLGGIVQLSPIASRNHNDKISSIMKHLRKKHKLIAAGYFMALGNAVGIAVGVSVGVATGNIGAGFGIGAGLGAAIGTALEAKAKKDKRII